MTNIALAAVCAVFVGCGGHIARIEQHNPSPPTWAEACVEREMDCITASRGGGIVTTLLLPFAALRSDEISGEMIVRHCQLQGELCRMRNKVSSSSP